MKLRRTPVRTAHLLSRGGRNNRADTAHVATGRRSKLRLATASKDRTAHLPPRLRARRPKLRLAAVSQGRTAHLPPWLRARRRARARRPAGLGPAPAVVNTSVALRSGSFRRRPPWRQLPLWPTYGRRHLAVTSLPLPP
jgi:hypothetical protein